MKVKQLFERFSQPMQTVTIVEVFDPRLSSEYLWEGYVKDISSKFLNRDVFSWCAGYQNDYMLNDYYKTDIVVSIDGTRNESYSRKESKSRTRKRSIKEGDASKKTNYAVAVRDMHTAHIHLLTGTKSECEVLMNSLEVADDYMNDDFMDEYEKDEYIQNMYDEVFSQYGWINDISYRDIDNRNNYYDHDSGKYYHILNDAWFDLYL